MFIWLICITYRTKLSDSDASAYIFVSITQDAEKEEFYDESRRLCDLRLFQPILKLVEPEGNLDEKIANSEISQAMGIHTNDFDEISDAEVIECRRNIFHYIADCFHERNAEGCKSQALYKFPPEVEDNPDLPPSMLAKLDRGYVKIAIWFLSDTFDKQKHTIAVQVIDWLCANRISSSILRKVASE